MESVYAALLLHKAKKAIDEKAISKILEAAGFDVDKNQVKALVAGLSGKNLDELVANAAAVPVAAAPSVPAAAGEKKEGKKEEKKEEKKKEEEVAGLSSLFE